MEQLAIVLSLFIIALVIVSYCYTLSREGSWEENFGQAFVDLTNPETMHKSVYEPNSSSPHYSPSGLAFVYVIGAVVFTGLLIATITNIFRARSDKFRRGSVKYSFSGHIVFLGYNNLVAGMIQKLCEEGIDKVVVGVENDASTICNKIKNRLFEKYRDNVVVLQADSCNMKDLKRLRVTHAKEVYIIGEYDDAYNLRCYRTIYELFLREKSAKAKMPNCYVNLHSQASLTLFRTYASAGDLGIDFSTFHSFSFYDEWARTMIQKKWKVNDNLQDHFFIAGMTEMGVALARKAILLCHNSNDKTPIKISFIDNEAGKKSRLFIIQHQELFNQCDYIIVTKEYQFSHDGVNNNLDFIFEFIEGDLLDNAIRKEVSQSVDDPQQKKTIVLCYDDPMQNLTMGLNLPNNVYEEKSNTKVWIYQTTLGDLGYYLKNSKFNNVDTFGMSGHKLDVRNEENTRRAKLINHYFRNQLNQKYQNNNQNDKIIKIDYADQYLIETEWERASISRRWAYIRIAEFIPFLKPYLGDDMKMENMDRHRSAVDNLLFPLEYDNLYPIKNNYSVYIATIKRILTTNSFTFIKEENDGNNEKE